MRQVEITRLGHLGDGVTDGGTFVPFTLPGELAEGEEAGGRIEAPRILRPSPERIAPACPSFGACGGCALQHASASFLAAWKRDRIAEALADRGLTAEIRETIATPQGSRRRATLSGRRGKRGATVGFHARAGARVIRPEGCAVLRPEILAALPGLEELTTLAASRKGEVKIAVTVAPAGLDVDLSEGKPPDGPGLARAAALASAQGWARLSWNGEAVAMARPPALAMGAATVVPPPGGFLQATEEGEAALVAAMLEAAGPARRAVDLFAGCGTFSLPLAARAEVLAAEGDAALLQALDAGWRGAGGALKRVRTEERDLFRRPLLPEELARFDAAVIDPPRAGAKAQTEALAASAVPRIAAISCEPATFARDARILADGGYALDWVLPVDQFLWSPHVELAAAFSRR